MTHSQLAGGKTLPPEGEKMMRLTLTERDTGQEHKVPFPDMPLE